MKHAERVGDTAAASGVWGALGVRAHETRAVRGLFRASVMLGLALVSFYGSSNALFLTSYDIDVLPWVYIVNAVLVIVVGLAYSVASRHLPIGRVLVGSTVAFAASVLLLWLAAAVSEADAVAFVIAVWFRLLFIFALLGLWEVASTIFDVRQAKRLFPAVALGVMVAFVVGGMLTGVVTRAIGATHLLAVSGLCFALYAVGFGRVLHAEMSDAVPDSVPPAGPRDILADRYSRLLAAMRSITILLIYIGEFVLYEQAAAMFDDEGSLATFFGVFIGGSTLLMVIVTAVVSARFIAHYGIKVGLMTMPVGVGVTAAAAALWGALIGVDVVFFALVVLSTVTNTVLANSIETPVGAVMFQPLPTDRRMPVRVAVDGWLGSVALVAAGFLLLGFAALDFGSVVPFSLLLAALSAVGVVMARQLYGGYEHALRVATTRAFSGEVAMSSALGDSSADVIAGGGATGFAASALLLAESDASAAGPYIDSMLDHPDPMIVEAVLGSGVELSHGANRADRLATATERTDLSGEGRGHALQALAKLDGARAHRLAQDQRGATGPLGEAADAVLLLSDAHRVDVADRLRARATAPALDERLTAARMVQHVGPDLAEDLSGSLLADESEDVRRQTLRSLEGKVSPSLVSSVLSAGESPALRRHAVVALAESEPDVLDPVSERLHLLDLDYQAELIEHVYSRHTRRPALLHPFVAPGQPSQIRQAGFTAIQRADIVPPASPGRMLRDDVELARDLTAAWRDIGPEFEALRSAVASEFDRARASIYRALAIDYVADRVHDIQAIAARGRDEDRANAIEALDVMLATDLRRVVVPVLEPRTIVEAAVELSDLPERRPPHDWIADLADDQRLGRWTTETAQHERTPPDKGQPMTELIERIAALKAVDIFATLPYPLLAELAQVVHEQRFETGETIIAEGALDQELYALTSGTVTVQREDGAVELSAGTVFGELAVLDPAPRSADVVAASACSVLVVRRETLLSLADRRPEVMVEIAGVLARRLRP